MLAFEVSINGVKRCTTGIEANGCMMAILTWLQQHPPRDRYAHPYDNRLDFDVGAAWSKEEINENGKWLKETLTVGDSITIRLLEATEVDALTIKQQCSTPRDRDRSERLYYEQLKQKYRRVNRRRKKTAS